LRKIALAITQRISGEDPGRIGEMQGLALSAWADGLKRAALDSYAERVLTEVFA
jgi:hypothetical protein